MKKSDFSFDLPEELIADRPCARRSGSRLLKVPVRGEFADLVFDGVARLLNPGDLLVVNDSRVIRARLSARKESGGRVEVLVERLLDDGCALALVRAAKPLRDNARLLVGDATVRVAGRRGDLFLLEPETEPGVESGVESGVGFGGECTFSQLLERFGEVPLPPYIRRPPEAFDESRYQTVYAKHPGSVAAPTAGLHFDRGLLERLECKGVEVAALTLHVGAGTFQPLRAEKLGEHVMHRERVRVPARLCDAAAACRKRGGRIVAVGTTVVRALETACDAAGKIHPYEGETDLFIRPGYRFRVSDALITNFHLPETTLFVLVCAFSGRRRMFEAYRHAVERRYRFFSYGDATWLERNDAVCD